MMKTILPLLLALVFLSSGFSKNQKKAGYYDHDELLKLLPGYQKSLDSAAVHSKEYRAELVRYEKSLAEKATALGSPDTAKWSALILAVQKLDLTVMQQRASNLRDEIILDSIHIIQQLQWPLEKKIDSAAAKVKTANKLDTIFDRKNQMLYDKLTQEHTKLKDVNDKMKTELNLK